MKNFLFVALSLVLIGCVNDEIVIKETISSLEQQKSLSTALGVYKNKFDVHEYQGRWEGSKTNLYTSLYNHLYADLRQKTPMICRTNYFDYMKNLIKPDIRLECLCSDYYERPEQNIYKSDDCILYRRQLELSPIAFFDYKRFLSDKYLTLLPTDQHFQFIHDMWHFRVKKFEYYSKELVIKCKESKNLTSDERKQCEKAIVEFYEEEKTNPDDWITYMQGDVKQSIETAIFVYNANSCNDRLYELFFNSFNSWWDGGVANDFNRFEENRNCYTVAKWFALQAGKTVKEKPEIYENFKKWDKLLSENPSKQ